MKNKYTQNYVFVQVDEKNTIIYNIPTNLPKERKDLV